MGANSSQGVENCLKTRVCKSPLRANCPHPRNASPNETPFEGYLLREGEKSMSIFGATERCQERFGQLDSRFARLTLRPERSIATTRRVSSLIRYSNRRKHSTRLDSTRFDSNRVESNDGKLGSSAGIYQQVREADELINGLGGRN